MTIHYHGTPITPYPALLELRGRCFCVSFAAPQQVEACHRIGQSVLLDNGAFSAWKRKLNIDWQAYYRWCEPWLDYPTTWAIIPDSITGSIEDNDLLISQWPFKKDRGAPVWHLHEPLDRLLKLCDEWPKVCFGSSAQYATIGNKLWHKRIQEAFNAINTWPTWIRMLRGMSLAGGPYPFASLDSTDVGRNHNRRNNPGQMAKDWDSMNTPAKWHLK